MINVSIKKWAQKSEHKVNEPTDAVPHVLVKVVVGRHICHMAQHKKQDQSYFLCVVLHVMSDWVNRP
jgi:hypothetical protein